MQDDGAGYLKQVLHLRYTCNTPALVDIHASPSSTLTRFRANMVKCQVILGMASRHLGLYALCLLSVSL